MADLGLNQLDHVGLHVADVAKSCQFYERVLLLRSIARPDFDFPGAWYRLGASQELHLITGIGGAPRALGGANHLALQVKDLKAWTDHLDKLGIDFRQQVRPDGIGQIYVHDPDGHSIELCEACS